VLSVGTDPGPEAASRRPRGLAIALSVVAFGSAVNAQAASAQSRARGASFALRPVLYDPAVPATKSYFIFVAKPGTTVHNQVRVTNVGRKAGTAFLYPVDATTGQTSGTVYLGRVAPRRDVGAWLQLRARRVRLRAGQSRVVSFTLRVPARTRPGQHVGGIVAQNAAVRSARAVRKGTRLGGFHIRIRQLTIIGVQTDLPGRHTEELAVGSVTAGGGHGYQILALGLHNTGTMLLRPHGRMSVTDSHERTVQRRRLRLDTFLPATGIAYPVFVKGRALPAGSYRAHLVLRYGHDRVTRATVPFTILSRQVKQVFTSSRPVTPPTKSSSSRSLGQYVPWLVAALGLVVGVVGAVALHRARRAV
jgi:hypothetical protein